MVKKYSKEDVITALRERANRVHSSMNAQEVEYEEGNLTEDEKDIVSANIEELSDWEKCLRDVAFEIEYGDILK